MKPEMQILRFYLVGQNCFYCTLQIRKICTSVQHSRAKGPDIFGFRAHTSHQGIGEYKEMHTGICSAAKTQIYIYIRQQGPMKSYVHHSFSSNIIHYTDVPQGSTELYWASVINWRATQLQSVIANWCIIIAASCHLLGVFCHMIWDHW